MYKNMVELSPTHIRVISRIGRIGDKLLHETDNGEVRLKIFVYYFREIRLPTRINLMSNAKPKRATSDEATCLPTYDVRRSFAIYY